MYNTNTQHLRTGFPALDPARSARARLLNDPELRRNRPAPTAALSTPPAESVTYTPLSAELIRPDRGAGLLSRGEQESRARQVAQSFRQHRLVDLTYHAEQQIVLAMIRPTAPDATELPHQICVEANGNVSVLHNAGPVLCEQQRLVVHRLLLLLSALTAVAAILFSLVLL